jgi:isopentenyl phosphate kinase
MLHALNFKKLVKMVNGMKVKEVPLHHVCQTYVEGKHQRTYFPKNKMTMASKLSKVVHSDVCRDEDNILWWSTILCHLIEEFLKKTHVYLWKLKGEVFEKFKAYKVLVKNETNMKIKTLQFDNGRKFVSKKLDNFLRECGI